MNCMIVTVVYALPDAAIQIEVSLPPGATAAEALDRSGLATRFPGVDFRRLAQFHDCPLAETAFDLLQCQVYRLLTLTEIGRYGTIAAVGRSFFFLSGRHACLQGVRCRQAVALPLHHLPAFLLF